MNLKRNIAAELDKILTGLEIKNKTTRIIIFFKGNVIRVEINVILNKVATFSQSNFCIAVGRTYRNATDNNKAREWNKYATNQTKSRLGRRDNRFESIKFHGRNFNL